MTKHEAVDRLKLQRARFRSEVLKELHRTIELAAAGGHFPDFESLSKQIMSSISEKMASSPEISTDEWIVMLQEKEPDKFCKRTMDIVEGLCQK